MDKENFSQRKNDILNKKDKSYAGEWDLRIKKLCEKINESEDYYTTSSCSGRVVLMKEGKTKTRELFLFTTHEFLKRDVLGKELAKYSGKELIKFKCESPILHIACKDVQSAKKILRKGINLGWKNSGIITLGRNIIVELHGTEKFEFPIKLNGKNLVDENFLDLVRGKSNEKLEKGWELIEKLFLEFEK